MKFNLQKFQEVQPEKKNEKKNLPIDNLHINFHVLILHRYLT